MLCRLPGETAVRRTIDSDVFDALETDGPPGELADGAPRQVPIPVGQGAGECGAADDGAQRDLGRPVHPRRREAVAVGPAPAHRSAIQPKAAAVLGAFNGGAVAGRVDELFIDESVAVVIPPVAGLGSAGLALPVALKPRDPQAARGVHGRAEQQEERQGKQPARGHAALTGST